MIALSVAERYAALHTGATVMRHRVRPLSRKIRVRVGPNLYDAVAVWRWPGLVRVVLSYSGELVVESLPGRPLVPSAAANSEDGEQLLHATAAERLEALSIAARVLRDCELLLQSEVLLFKGSVQIAATATWHWPGVLFLTGSRTGTLIANSKPGDPFGLAVSEL